MEENHFSYDVSDGGRIKDMFRHSSADGEILYYTFEVNYTYPDIAVRKAKQLALLDKAEEIIDAVGIYSGGTRVEEIYAIKDRKSTRLNSSHGSISYAVFCLKKKKAAF